MGGERNFGQAVLDSRPNPGRTLNRSPMLLEPLQGAADARALVQPAASGSRSGAAGPGGAQGGRRCLPAALDSLTPFARLKMPSVTS